MGTTKFKRANGRSGFTLVEILVVVTLLTMLALIAIPNFLSARKDSAKSSCINNIKEISYATEQWALEKKMGPSAAVTFDDISAYLKGAIVCPAGGKTFDDSYTISIVANEPTCLRQPQDHYWLGSTTVAAVQANGGDSGGIADSLIGSPAPASTSAISSASKPKGKGNGKGK